jgi:hypothetical protein
MYSSFVDVDPERGSTIEFGAAYELHERTDVGKVGLIILFFETIEMFYSISLGEKRASTISGRVPRPI